MNSNIHQGLPQAPPSRVGKILKTFGHGTVLVPTQWGTKKPMQNGYTDFTPEKMSDIHHLDLLEQNNIAILTGSKSGNLISVDFDDDAAFEQFRACNPQLCSTVKTQALRGCNLWFRMIGEYPEGVSKLMNESGKEIGEWRAGGGITIVDGQHPGGIGYRITSASPLREIPFDEIQWPEDWTKVPVPVDPFDVLVEEFGPPVFEGKQGGLQLNESFVPGWIATENEILYALETQQFFQYDETAGIWKVLPKQVVNKLIAEFLARLARESNLDTIHLKKKATIINSVRGQLEAEVACEFYRTINPQGWRSFAAHNAKIALILPSDEMKAQLCELPFSPGDRLIEKSCVGYAANASCPRFHSKVLSPFLEPDDIVLLQKMLGLILAGDNELQKILLLEGPGGTSKGVITRVLDRVLGPKLVTELRTDHLGSRFETNRYRGKRLLAGRDVDPNFLRSSSASRLKALSGGDRLSTESKNSNEFEDIEGVFHVIITSNSPLLLRIDEDASAWKRRLVIVPFHESGQPFKIIQKFEEQLLREEGPGILKWMLEGALLAFSDIANYGTVALTPRQEARVDARVRASDSVAFFADECLVALNDNKLSSQQLLDAYSCFCESLALTAVTQTEFYRKIKLLIESRFGGRVKYTENLLNDGGRGRGYRGLNLKPRSRGKTQPHG